MAGAVSFRQISTPARNEIRAVPYSRTLVHALEDVMQTRREFLSGATVTLLLIPIAACSSSSNASSGETGVTGDSGLPGCDGVGATSSVANNHTHTVCVPETDLTNAPAAGGTYVTSNVLSHTHNVTLTQAQLQALNVGQSVTLTSTGIEPNHDFTLQKA
jgi:hypothetical protein